MNYLKIVSKGWQGYTGQLNIISFVNGVSTEPVPDIVANRIAASVSIVKCDAEGEELEENGFIGIQHRLVAESASRAPVVEPLSRQSDGEKSMEQKLDAAAALKAPIDNMFSKEDLERVADESGIKGIRAIAEKWNVKGRSIPELINDVLNAQSKFVAERNALLERSGGSVLKHTQPLEETIVEEEVEEETLVAAAFEGIAAFYVGADGFEITGEALVLASLKNSGKSLSGWNALEDKDREKLILEEIAALETVHGVISPGEIGSAAEPAVEPVKGDDQAGAATDEVAQNESTEGAEDAGHEQGSEAA